MKGPGSGVDRFVAQSEVSVLSHSLVAACHSSRRSTKPGRCDAEIDSPVHRGWFGTDT
jgi:hypothetical protein